MGFPWAAIAALTKSKTPQVIKKVSLRVSEDDARLLAGLLERCSKEVSDPILSGACAGYAKAFRKALLDE